MLALGAALACILVNGFFVAVEFALGSQTQFGTTDGSDFPVTANAYQKGVAGGGSFVVKLGPGGNTLVYSTYLVGATANGIAVDAAGNAYVAGSATPSFTTTPEDMLGSLTRIIADRSVGSLFFGNYHLTSGVNGASLITLYGTVPDGLVNDFDRQPRPTGAPDRGADEVITPVPTTPVPQR